MMALTTITLSRRNGNKQVKATLFKSGKLGVHRRLSPMLAPSDRWGITHVPTGLGVARAPNKSDALRLMRYIDSWNWDFTSKASMPKETADRAPEIRKLMAEGVPAGKGGA